MFESTLSKLFSVKGFTFLSIWVFLQISCSILKAQSALNLRDGITITVDPAAVLYVQGDMQISNTTDTARIINNGTIDFRGDLVNNTSAKVFRERSGKVELNGSSIQLINGPFSFNNLELNNGSGASISGDTVTIFNTLTLSAGNFAANGNLVINSDEVRTARIAELTAGTISGNVIVERYIDSTSYGARFVGTPIQGTTLSDWLDDIVFSGFIGTQFPNWHFNNVYYYDEAVAGTADNGYRTATNITNTVGVGEGIQLYLGGKKIKLDASGPVNTGSTNLPVTFTDDITVANTHDGWNMVANPYPSAIDWLSNAWVKSNVDNAVYIYDGTNNVYSTFVGGMSANGGSRYIASSQAFWVHTNAASPLLQANEGIKVSNDPDFIESTPSDYLRIKIAGVGAKTDEVVLNFDPLATDSFDVNFDAFKLLTSAPNQLALNKNGESFSILSLNDNSFFEKIDLKTQVTSSGQYSLQFENSLEQSRSCIYLFDKFTGRLENLSDSVKFHFNLSDTTQVARFELRVGSPISYQLIKPFCFGQKGQFKLQANWPLDTVIYNLKNRNSGFSQSGSITNQLDSLAAYHGVYDLQLSYLGCTTKLDSIELNQPDSISTMVNSSFDSLANSYTVWASSSGGTKPYHYQWFSQASIQTDTVFNIQAGNHQLITVDANGCADTIMFNIGYISVGLSSSELDTWKVFPNPAKDFIRLASSSSLPYEIQLFDLNGKLVIEQSAQGETDIDITNLSQGTYILRVSTKNHLMTKRIIKL